ncbi:uncharacterized protein LOC105194097 [Solenopsis invicta]|uniref:uncharacterized protein LOC105194097 n=1 Tax=Solenopsis invicta TaxID=13686 RepID=UPI0005961A27|nr:uncharacterized protein LOC105194097 [Solenopsis invicta]
MVENVGAIRDGRNLVLRILESSVLKLKALDFKPYFGLDQVTFKVSGAQGGDRESEKGPPMDELNVVMVELDVDASGGKRKAVVCSAYFPHDEGSLPPPESVTKLVEHCKNKRLPLIVRCNANSHHTVWGSTDTNDRGRKLLEFLASTDLEILNRGNKPTFCTAVRREVLELTVCSRCILRDVVGWRVSRELSLSDHRQITFKLTWAREEVTMFRDSRSTDWDSYRMDLKCYLESFPRKHGIEKELELYVDHLQRALVASYKKNCPERAIKNSKDKFWWSLKLQELRSVARMAWNRARNTSR